MIIIINPIYTALRGLGKSVKILNHFARGKIKFINYISTKLNKKN
jgi:hypothetical protein